MSRVYAVTVGHESCRDQSSGLIDLDKFDLTNQAQKNWHDKIVAEGVQGITLNEACGVAPDYDWADYSREEDEPQQFNVFDHEVQPPQTVVGQVTIYVDD